MKNINIQYIDDFQELKQFASNFDIDNQSLVVSSIKAKTDFQFYFIQQNKITSSKAVQTFYELLEDILFWLYPSVRLVSSHYIKTIIEEDTSSPGKAAIVFDFLELVLPVFSHPNGYEIMLEWSKGRDVSWKSWIDEAYKAYNLILDLKITTHNLIPALLFNEDISSFKIDKPSFFYLGCNFEPIHAHLLEGLGKNNDITLLCPNRYWIDKYKSLKTYSRFDELKTDSQCLQKKSQGNIHTKRFSSMLSEVKDAVSQVRIWIDEGVNTNSVIITAPNIEEYWKVLKAHLDVEGIAYDKPTKISIKSFSDTARLVSFLRLQIMPNKNDLCLAIFGKTKPIISYDLFVKMYSTVTRFDDYKRSQEVYDFLYRHHIPDTPNLTEFIDYISKVWKQIDGDVERLELILTRIFQDDIDQKMALPKWLSYLEMVLSDIKVTIEHPNLSGIGVVSLSQLDRTDIKKIYMMGMSDQAMNISDNVPIVQTDLDDIERDTGFVLDNGSNDLEFKTEWIISANVDAVLSFPENNFSSDELTPSYLWIKYAKEASCIDPKKTRWDIIQHNNLNNYNNIDSNKKIKQSLETYKLDKLSASDIETYVKCPFIFYARKVLGLRDQKLLGLDLSYIDQGTLLHDALDKLVTEPFKPPTKNEIKNVLKTIIDKNAILEQKYLSKVIDKYANFLKRCLDFEFQQRNSEEYESIETILKEIKYETYFLPEKKSFSKTQYADAVLVYGKIDRIDSVNSATTRVIDYKRSGTHTHYNNWFKNGYLQLILYSIVTNEGFIPGASKVVSEAFYFILKDLKFRGFFLDQKSNKRGKISRADLDKLYEDFKDRLKDIITNIQQANFDPNPMEPKNCHKCYLNKSCRYNYE